MYIYIYVCMYAYIYIYTYMYAYGKTFTHVRVYGGCAKFFCTKMTLAPALGEPCAFLVRPRSRLMFVLSMFSCRVFV